MAVGCADPEPALHATWYAPSSRSTSVSVLLLSSDGRASLTREEDWDSASITMYGRWTTLPDGMRVTFDRTQVVSHWGPKGWRMPCTEIQPPLEAVIRSDSGGSSRLTATWLDETPIPMRRAATLRRRQDIEDWLTPRPEGVVPETELDEKD